MKNILVVGNGFDLALNLQTNYVHFANSKYWTLNDENFKKAGGDNLFKFLSHKADPQKEKYGTIRWMDIEDFLYEYVKKKSTLPVKFSREEVDFDRTFYNRIKFDFCQYLVEQVNTVSLTPTRVPYCIKNAIEPIIHNKTFKKVYSFNYTDTAKILKECFKWSPMVIHLHGRALTTNSDIVLGIGSQKDVSDDFRFMLKTYSKSYFAHDFIDDITHANEIVLYGLSLGPADFVYFSEFVKTTLNTYRPGNPKKVMHIFTLNTDSKDKILDSFINFGFDLTEVYSKLKIKFYYAAEAGLGFNGFNPYEEFKIHMEKMKPASIRQAEYEVNNFMQRYKGNS